MAFIFSAIKQKPPTSGGETNNYGITNFYFPSDTFNHNEKWVEEFCDYIIESPMNGNIEWIANVNVASFTEYMAMEMKNSVKMFIVQEQNKK